jgi:type III restriction enzyme
LAAGAPTSTTRHHKFTDVRPFFCQIEAVETAIWLIEVAPQLGKTGKRFLGHLADANNASNPERNSSGGQS